jgi:hypothetical protein
MRVSIEMSSPICKKIILRLRARQHSPDHRDRDISRRLRFLGSNSVASLEILSVTKHAVKQKKFVLAVVNKVC